MLQRESFSLCHVGAASDWKVCNGVSARLTFLFFWLISFFLSTPGCLWLLSGFGRRAWGVEERNGEERLYLASRNKIWQQHPMGLADFQWELFSRVSEKFPHKGGCGYSCLNQGKGLFPSVPHSEPQFVFLTAYFLFPPVFPMEAKEGKGKKWTLVLFASIHLYPWRG